VKSGELTDTVIYRRNLVINTVHELYSVCMSRKIFPVGDYLTFSEEKR